MKRDQRSLPDPRVEPTLTVEDAGRLLNFGRAKSYQEASRYLATDGAEGLPVVAFGRSLRVPTAALLKLLGIESGGTISPSARLPGTSEPNRAAGPHVERSGCDNDPRERPETAESTTGPGLR
jgi:hypothetical protein